MSWFKKEKPKAEPKKFFLVDNVSFDEAAATKLANDTGEKVIRAGGVTDVVRIIYY